VVDRALSVCVEIRGSRKGLCIPEDLLGRIMEDSPIIRVKLRFGSLRGGER